MTATERAPSMVWFESRLSSGYRYAIVVENVPVRGRWMKKVVQSFGRHTPDAERAARLQVAVLNAKRILEGASLG